MLGIVSCSADTCPTDSEFLHDEGCRTPSAEPEWGNLGNGQWKRVCNCRRGVWTAPDTQLDPNSNAAMPSWRAHIHAPGCEAAEVEAVVRIERRIDAEWKTTCPVCGTLGIFYWNPDAVDGNGRPVRREANVFYTYELAHKPVPG